MKIALIYPNIGRKGYSLFLDGARMEPLGLTVIAGLMPPDIDVKIYDDFGTEIALSEWSDGFIKTKKQIKIETLNNE